VNCVVSRGLLGGTGWLLWGFDQLGNKKGCAMRKKKFKVIITDIS